MTAMEAVLNAGPKARDLGGSARTQAASGAVVAAQAAAG